MTTCGHCAHWALTKDTPDNFRKSATASCALDKPWTYYHATKTCDRASPASAAAIAARREVVKQARKEKDHDAEPDTRT